jgi:hypothetical protein
MKYSLKLNGVEMGYPIDDKRTAEQIQDIYNRKIAALYGKGETPCKLTLHQDVQDVGRRQEE